MMCTRPFPINSLSSSHLNVCPLLKYLVNWMNFKAFGTLEPDFSGKTQLLGSHHTIAFYRKGIGHFMPAGQDEDWDPDKKTGNPTRSEVIREYIKKVKGLTEKSAMTPKKTKRNSEDGDQKKKASKSKKKARTSTGSIGDASYVPVSVTDEVNTLLRHIHATKNKFMRSLDEMGAAVDKMKSDVEMSYGVMISQVSNIGSTITAAHARGRMEQATATVDLKTSEVPVSLRTRNLFTAWNVQNGKLTPLPENWNFPNKLSVIEAMNLWFMGDSQSNTPPLEYLTVSHMKHVKGAVDGLNKLKTFMKICKYLGLKAGYWCLSWNSDRITALWTKIWPGIELHIGLSTNDARTGEMSYRTMLNSIWKQGGIKQEMNDNLDIISEGNINVVVAATEEARALLAAQGGQEQEEIVDTNSLELLWGVHNGKLNPLPADWEFPHMSSILNALHLWLIGDVENKIPPFMYVVSSHLAHIKSGSGYLSKLRCVMKVIKHHGVKLGCWLEQDWDDEKIKFLWTSVWDDVEEKIKFKRSDGRTGECTWQSVYNRMHESGIIKDVNADNADQEASQDEEVVEVGAESVEV